MREKQLCRHRSECRRRGGGAPGARADFPLQPRVQTMAMQVVPCSHGGSHTGAGGCAPKEAVTPWRACAGAGSWQDLWPCGELPTQEQVFWQDPHWSSPFLKDCTPWKGPMVDRFMENCLLCRGPHAGAGAEREEEGASATTHDELATAPIPRPPALLGRR